MTAHRIRTVGEGWTWFADYAVANATFTINTPPGRQVEIGTGVSIRGTPRGARRRITGYGQVVVWGIGAVHIRVTDSSGPCRVRVEQGELDPIVIVDEVF